MTYHFRHNQIITINDDQKNKIDQLDADESQAQVVLTIHFCHLKLPFILGRAR